MSLFSIECGESTGLYLKLNDGAKVLVAFYLCTNQQKSSRDPLQITIEGSQAPETSLDRGSQWTLIYNGSSGLLTDPGRSSRGALMTLANILVVYSSFRLLTVSKRYNRSSVSCSEWWLLMY
jgi:alpha-L-fucosidase 2